MRIFGILRATAESEAGVPPSPEMMEKMGKFMGEVAQAGVLTATDGFKPTSVGKRIKLSDGKVTVTDGPFTGDELISAYCVYQVSTWDDAIHWTKRFLEVLGGGECELRPMFEASDFA